MKDKVIQKVANFLDLPDKERAKIVKKAFKEAKKMQDEKIKLYNIKAFKEALYGEDLTKLNKLLNEEITR